MTGTTSDTVTYKCLNHSGITNTATEPGVYTIQCTVQGSKYSKVMTADLTILDTSSCYATDSSKTQFTFNENLKYQDLKTELFKNNFTVVREFSMDYFTAGTRDKYKSVTSSRTIISVDGDKFFSTYYDISNDNGVETVKSVMFDWGVLCGDYYCTMDYLEGAFEERTYEKIPAEYRYERYNYAYEPFVYLDESINGGFEGKTVANYHTYYSTLLGLTNNEFKFEYRDHYYHSEFDDDEVMTVGFYNIGNTKITLPEEIMPSEAELDKYGAGQFTYDGVEYYKTSDKTYGEYYRATIDISFEDLVLVPNGNITLLPEIEGVMVSLINMPYYIYNEDYSGYTLRTYFDSNLTYCGPYEGKGTVRDPKKYLKSFENYGGVISYYSDWNN